MKTPVHPVQIRIRYSDEIFEAFPDPAAAQQGTFRHCEPNLEDHLTKGATPEEAAANWMTAYRAPHIIAVEASGEELFTRMNEQMLKELHAEEIAAFDPHEQDLDELVQDTALLEQQDEEATALLELYAPRSGSTYTSKVSGDKAKGKAAAFTLIQNELANLIAQKQEDAEAEAAPAPKKNRKSKKVADPSSDIPDGDRITVSDLAAEAGISPAKARKLLRAAAKAETTDLDHTPKQRWLWDRNDEEELARVRAILKG